MDLSSPEGHSISNGVSKSLCSLLQISVNTTVKIIAHLGRGSLLAKVDIPSAIACFQFIPTTFGCLEYDGKGAFVLCRHFLLASAWLRSHPQPWQMLLTGSSSRRWLSQCYTINDFLLMGPLGSLECVHDLTFNPVATFDRLGVLVATH